MNGEVVTRKVTVRNSGNEELVIEAVSTSCGCTQPTLEPMAIPPDENGTLRIVFDSEAHGEELTGALMRQVFIASNDPEQPEAVLEFEPNILPPESPKVLIRQMAHEQLRSSRLESSLLPRTGLSGLDNLLVGRGEEAVVANYQPPIF